MMKGLKVFVKTCAVMLMCVGVIQVKAQTKHVVYIQSDDKKPFYVTINEQTKNSTESGYVILSQLTNSQYFILIGSSGNEFPEQKFLINMNDNDWEFTFKKNDSGKYLLYDMIHLTALNTYKEPEPKSADVAVTTHPVQDTIQQKTVVKVDTIAVVPEQKAIVKDTVAAVITNSIHDSSMQKATAKVDTVVAVAEKVEIKDTPVAVQPPPTESKPITQPVPVKNKNLKVNKIFERITADGVDLIFVDERKPKFDTVAIYIPRTKVAEEERPKKIAEPVKPKPVAVTVTPDQTATPPVNVTKPRCNNVASDDDFLSLRKQMASANTEDDMLSTAKNSFANKCYSVAQIKNLSVLFLNEKNKFSFFTIARPATSDSKDFYKLINQLTQPDLIEKFAALIQQ